MPNDGEGYFTRVAIGLQGALADAEPAAYGFIVKPFVRFGRIADKLFNTVDKVCNSEQCRSHALRSMIMSFIALILFSITLLLLGKQTVMQSIAVLIECKK